MDFRVLGGQHINGYIFTESRHTRVPQMRGAHECYEQALLGGQQRKGKLLQQCG